MKYNFSDLYSLEGIARIDHDFMDYLEGDLCEKLMLARKNPPCDKEESALIIELAPYLEDFLSEQFDILPEVKNLRHKYNEMAILFECKRQFIQKRVTKQYKAEDILGKSLQEPDFMRECSETGLKRDIFFASQVMKMIEREENLDQALLYAAFMVYNNHGGILFRLPKKLDPMNLVKKPEHFRNREGFSLTDAGFSDEKPMDQANYCIWCHNQGKDSCSKGMREKDRSFKKNQMDITLAGCPLEEKISEMNFLKSEGYILGALGVIIIDNPMVAATGHRICNDCMKACIYQKQEPVNIPMIETSILKDVLALPYGFELYSLFTRWNPLNFKNPLPKAGSGKKILVAGMGPAGFTLAHYLLNDGHIVVGIDGLKIDPLSTPTQLSTPKDGGYGGSLIRDISTLFEDLDQRKAYGFGGVAEYGITVRWEKNYLTLIRLILERRANFQLFGGIRLGSNLTIGQAWEMGFDHISLCFGAGKPNLIQMKNGFARGVRTASDFLMSLQSTGAARKESIANLQVRMPIVVIGGGLTAIDTATEALAYYPRQLEKFAAANYQEADLTEEEKIIAQEFIAHHKELLATKDRLQLLKKWGGAKVLYRKKLQDAPSYRLNHEEVELAFEEGIEFIEDITPLEVLLDEYGAAYAIRTSCGDIAARTILIAAGTVPNTVIAREDPDNIKLDGKYFRIIDGDGEIIDAEKVSKPDNPSVITSIDEEGRAISFFGDLHPSYAGNVVKAMGSAKQGYPLVSAVLTSTQLFPLNREDFFCKIQALFASYIHEVNRLTTNIIEVIVHSPMAARNFKPGQFFRLQNYEAYSKKAMEGLALTGAAAYDDKISMIVLEMGGSSNLCKELKQGEPVVLMGPTGTPTEIPHNERVMLVGGGLGNAVLFSIGKAMRENGCKVIYFAGYKKLQDRYKIEEIEKAADIIIWACDEGLLPKTREQDFSFHGNIIEAIKFYAEENKTSPFRGKGWVGVLSSIDRVITIGSDRMMAAVAHARHNELKDLFKPGHIAIGSINSPMQCMMKEICAQCLQRHIDPKTKEESYVYSCYNQDQCLDKVDFEHLNARLKQNSLLEKINV